MSYIYAYLFKLLIFNIYTMTHIELKSSEQLYWLDTELVNGFGGVKSIDLDSINHTVTVNKVGGKSATYPTDNIGCCDTNNIDESIGKPIESYFVLRGITPY